MLSINRHCDVFNRRPSQRGRLARIDRCHASLRIWTLAAATMLGAVLGLHLPVAEAHNLQTKMVYVFFDDATQAMLDRRIAGQDPNFPNYAPPDPLLKVGDEVGLIVKVIPRDGTTTGVGGHVDFYVPNGTQVVDVGYVLPNLAGGFDKVPMKGQSPIALGAGSIGTKTTPELIGLSGSYTNVLGVTEAPVTANGTHRGTLTGLYGDTGIFFSTDPDTAWGSWQAFSNPSNPSQWDNCGVVGTFPLGAAKTITNNSGDVFVPCNKWDAEQMFAWGAKGTTFAGAGLRGGSIAIVDYPDQRGNTPWGFAAGTAGPQSGYAWNFDWDAYIAAGGVPTNPAHIQAAMAPSKVGPWQRIQYPGSRVTLDSPGSASQALGIGSIDASNLGTLVSPTTPLPATTAQTDTSSPKAIRWAVGQLTDLRPEYVWVKLRILDTSAILNPDGCPIFNADTFGGDAGGSDNGKDHLWRYYEPSRNRMNGCVALGKPTNRISVSAGGTFQYNVKFYNAGTTTLTGVRVTDTLPSGVTLLSAVPAQNSGPNPLVWNLGVVQPGDKFDAVVTVRASSSGLLTNRICVTSDQFPTPECADETVPVGNSPFLNQGKTVNVSTVAPGGTVAYTIRIDNIGSGPTGGPTRINEQLAPVFSYATLQSVTLNGANVTATTTVNATDPQAPIFTVPGGINAGSSLLLTFTAAAAANAPVGEYCNSYVSFTPTTPLPTGTLACVQVGGGQIGDTLFRDWNGNGVQDVDEEGMPGVTVTLTRPDSTTVTAVTDANGKYLFTGLLAGSYVVTVPAPGSGGVPTGYTLTADPDGAPFSPAYSLTLATNQQRLDVDFGYRPGGSGVIGDQLFEDRNNNGAQNAGEPFIDRVVTVNLYEDTNQNGLIDPGVDALVATTATNAANGQYGFTGLATGLDYLVQVDTTDADLIAYFAPNSFQASTPNPYRVQNLTGTVLTADFGFWAVQPGSIGDQVFIDTNGNGVFDAGDTPLANITVSLYRDANNNGVAEPGELIATTSSDPAGLYGFGGLGPDNYLVVVDTADPDIAANLFPAVTQYAKALAAGETWLLADFPFQSGLTKTVDKAFATTGQTLNFSLKPYFPGSDPLENVRLFDPLPTGTSYVNGSANAGGTFGAYSPLPAEPGNDPEGGDGNDVLDTAISLSANSVNVGATVTVTLNVKQNSGAAVANVTPGDLVATGGPFTILSGPTPASQSIPTGPTGADFTWTVRLDGPGEYVFSADAANAAETFQWPSAASASVLAAPDGGPNVVTWNLGTTNPRVPGETVISGAPASIYGFRGRTTSTFSRYGLGTGAWTGRANYGGGNVAKGGALTSDGVQTIYGLRGNGSQTFQKYDAVTNTWTALANTGVNVNEGGAAVFLRVGGGDYVYALMGNGTGFRRYNVATNSWEARANTPANVKWGGALTTDGTYIYATRGDGRKDFWRYDPVADAWSSLASAPQNIKWGGIVHLNGFIYSIRGDDKKEFYRYSIASNSWVRLQDAPDKFNVGSAITTDGVNLFALQGKDKAGFWRYNLASNTWTVLNGYPATVKDGGALAFLPAAAINSRLNELTAAPRLVATGDKITVTMTLTADQAINNVVPGAVTVAPAGTATPDSTNWTLVSADDDISGAGDAVSFRRIYTAAPGTAIRNITFAASATADASITFAAATSESVIAAPPLTWQSTVNAGAPAVIRNTGIIAETGNVLGSLPSNTTETATSASIGDFVWADADQDGVQDSGEPGISDVEVCVYQSDGTTLVACDTTDASGRYRVFGLTAGNYVVRYTPGTVPAGFLPTTAPSLSVTLTAAQQYNDADFGLAPLSATPGSIGDTVWLDANSNGTREPGEAGLPNISVALERLVDGNWVFVRSTTTDANGAYLFSGLATGSYRVTVDPTSVVTSPYDPSVTSTLGAAMVLTGGTSPTGTISLIANQNYVDADFGYNWGGSIGDLVWYDGNTNGVPDAGDGTAPGSTGCTTAPCGAPDATLVLYYDVNGNGAFDAGTDLPLGTDVSDNNGAYLFTNLPPGKYLVVASEQEVPSPVTGAVNTMVHTVAESLAVVLGPNQAYTAADFGLAELARVDGTVFHDRNNNGIFDGGDLPLAGITVTLTGTDANGNPVSLSTTTNADGEYQFLVLGGDYVISYDTSQTDGLGLTVPTSPVTLDVEVVNGVEYTGLDFGVANSGGLGNRVWNDANGNGAQDTGELGIPGVTVQLFATDGATLLRVTTTDSNGLYGFPGLANGTYVVRVLPPAGFTPTGEGDPGTACGVGCDNQITAIVSGGAVNNTVDFGYQPIATTYSVSGTVWDDNGANGGTVGNGVQDGNEPGIVGVTVCLRNASDNALVGCTATGGNGDYSFPGVPNGSYRVVVEPSTLPTNAYVQTGDPDGTLDHQTPITVAGANVTDRDFGYQQSLGSIAGAVCFGNGDGQCGLGEARIPGVQVTLYLQDASGVFQQVGAPVNTDASGNYLFQGLVPGVYQVRETNPAFLLGALADADGGNPDNISLALGLGQSVTGQDFEEEAASIGDRVWFDHNRDGIQDPDEPGIAGVTVTLTGTDGFGTAVNRTTTTDGSGVYRFDSLLGGTYDVTFMAPTGYQFTQQNAGAGPLADSFDSDADPTSGAVLGVVASGDNVTVDAGLYLTNGDDPSRISDFVWYDTDNDGIQDAAEPGLAGVTVKLYPDVDENGLPDSATPIAITVSDGNGFYEFAGLPGGSYVVEFLTPAGYLRSPQGLGSDPALDSDAAVGTGLTATIALAGGEDRTNIDAGMYIAGAEPPNLGDRVWYDTNGNGVQDTGEPGLPGVLVNLYDASGGLVSTTRTDSDGLYFFGGLAAGNYTVEFLRPAGYLISPANQGANLGLDSNPNPTTGLASVSLAAGVTDDSIDAGMRNPLSGPVNIGDFVWRDANANGLPDSGEGLGAVEVVLYDALGNELVRAITSALDANYLFTGLGAGDYRVAIDTSTLPDGALQIADPDTVIDDRHDLIGLAANTLTVDFGYATASLTLVKTASPTTYSAVRDVISYSFVVTNSGGVKITGPITIADDQTSNESCPALTTVGNNDAFLDPSESVSCSASYTITQSDIDAGTVVNIASAAGLDPNGDPVTSPTATETVTGPTAGPAINLSKIGTLNLGPNGTLEAGDTISYAFTVTNTGNVTLTNVTLSDRVAGVTLSGGPISSLAPLAVDSSTFTGSYVLTQADIDAATFSNTATTTGAPPSGPNVSDDDGDTQQLPPRAALTLVKGASPTTYGAVGQTISYSYLVTNTGNVTIAGLGVIDDKGTVTCPVAMLAPAAQATCTANYSITQDDLDRGSVTNVAQATGTFGPGNTPIASPTDAETVTAQQSPALTLVKSASPATYSSVGDVISYSYLVTNTGNVTINGLGVSDDNATVTCPVAMLAPGASTTCTATYMILGADITAGSVVNTAQANGIFGPGNTPVTSPTDTETVTVVAGGTVSHTVYEDTNGNGVQDVGEPGIANVQVQVTDSAGNVSTQTTDGNGQWSLAVPAGNTVIDILEGSLPAGYVRTQGTDPTTVSVPSGGTASDIDGFVPTWFIGDFVWHDTNRNGLQDPEEQGIAGVTVSLSGTDNLGNNVTLTTASDGSGAYLFGDLLPGTYTLAFTAPAGYRFTAPDQTGALGVLADAFDSDVNGSGVTPPIVLTGDNVTVDAGLYLTDGANPARISDRVWYDTNGNGIQDNGEPGVAGVVVELRDAAGTMTLATAVTDGSGLYEFAGLPAGDYRVLFTQPNGYTLTLQYATGAGAPAGAGDDSDANVANGLTDVIGLAAGQQLAEVDAGLYIDPDGPGGNPPQTPAGIGDRVWYDTDGDGIQDAGEPGIPGVRVYLLDEDGVVLAMTTTDPQGTYAFTGLPAGTYGIGVELPTGYDSYSPQGLGGNPALDSDINPLTGIAAVTLVAGEVKTDIDAGLFASDGQGGVRPPIVIGDYLWLDANNNGQPDNGEWFNGIDVVLYDALGFELARVTTATGGAADNYRFTGVAPGGYRVAVDTSTLPSVVSQIADPDSVLDHQTVLLNQSTSILTVDFGYRAAVPDLTPTITLIPNVMVGPTNFEVWVQCIELLGADTSGQIRLRVPKDSRWTLTNWDQSASSLPVSGRPLDNSIWTLSEDASALYFTTSAVILGMSQKNFGFSASWSAGLTVGAYTASVSIDPGSGGEVRINNNTNAEVANYSFQ